jgi:hypothetical protein
MSYWKDTLYFLAILVIFGIAGHFDYQDAVALEKAAHKQALRPCTKDGSQAPKSAIGAPIGTASTEAVPKQSQRPCASDRHQMAPS